ncbi:glycosyl transferase [Sphingobacterium sp. GVS05A]|uniref:glycosyl transferase n=1 Tax=Sphingobacterium sp. GVS05A TaxID=2862679 RepID=UPI001CBD41CE|nr:glycosyl transferase [Sphingobacterium sp. GVS05A]
MKDNGNEIIVPTYIINLKKRKDRLAHIKSQFKHREEFEINIVEASEHTIGALGLWQSICKVIRLAIEKDEDVIILCEDDHEFTEDYNRENFIESIYEAYRLKANLLLGGINGGFTNILPLPSGLFWLDNFWGTHFVVVFKTFFETILNEPFLDTDVADIKLAEMTSNKFVMYPMISIQKGFGYSDISKSNHTNEHLQYLNSTNALRLKKIYTAYKNSLLLQM